MEFNQAVVTTKGQILRAKLLAGSATAKVTKIAISSTVYQQSQLEGLTALTGIKQTTAPTSYESNVSTVKVVGAINNEGLTTGYYINTIGLYATDSDGSEMLYSVAIAIANGYMPPDTGVSKSGVELKIHTAVSNASKVDLTVDPAAVATKEDIKAVNDSLNTVTTYNPADYLAEGVTINASYSYIKKIGKQVFIQLFVTSEVSTSTTVLTLPEEIRPPIQDWSLFGGAYGGTVYGRASVNTTGAVTAFISTATANLFFKTSYILKQ